MVTPEHPDKPNTYPTPIHFENLEERLLLTTLHGGDFFIYLNTQGQNVRVDLIGNPGDTVELMTAWDADNGGTILPDDFDILDGPSTYPAEVEVMDLPGLRNPDLDHWDTWTTDGTTVVNWPNDIYMPYDLDGGGWGLRQADPNVLEIDPDTLEIDGRNQYAELR